MIHFRSQATQELVQNLISSEAALKNSERLNINLTINLKKLEKKIEIMETQMKDSNLKLLTARGQLETKEEELIFLKEGFNSNKNAEESPKIIDDLSAQLLEKDKMLATVWEELMIKDKLLSANAETTQRLRLEQAMFLEEAQKMQRRLVSKSDSEIMQIRMENHRLAQLIFYHEKLKVMLEQWVEKV